MTLPDPGGPGEVLEYAGDFGTLEDFLMAPAVVEGEASSPEKMLAALAALGVDPNNSFPQRPPLTGAPPLTEPVTDALSAEIAFVVTEPSGFALLAIAGLAFFFTQRRCRYRVGRGAAA